MPHGSLNPISDANDTCVAIAAVANPTAIATVHLFGLFIVDISLKGKRKIEQATHRSPAGRLLR